MTKGYQAKYHYGDLFTSKYMRMRYGQNLDLIKPKILSSDHVDVLDIGGYTGDLFQLIKQSFPTKTQKINYLILDYDNDGMDAAKERGIKVKTMDFNFQDIESQVKGEKFDIIICTEVLEHLLDPAKHIQAINNLLKTDGVALISLPNENTIFHRVFAVTGMGIDQYAFDLYKHLHFPTIKQARDFVSKYLTIKDYRYYINFSGKGSRLEWVGKILTLIPDPIWYKLTNFFPGLLARGTIFLCLKKKA